MGVRVTGDKARYGCEKGKLAAKTESRFCEIVPEANNNNKEKFQSKVDFVVKGKTVDVKASRPRANPKRSPETKYWSFCIRKQVGFVDFFVMFGLSESGETEKIFLIPGDQSVACCVITCKGKSKWNKFVVDEQELRERLTL